eukprot:TRINITY_DN5355_c0_g6_i1.p1 TRINITY_DN5355_c0_g6~~TRINITY_DN5355_c0_g6_i1.p1  ORF type:complete len:295 (+),score=78.16 TRINITY_DN5355_c0_g6_i1:105-887(+)
MVKVNDGFLRATILLCSIPSHVPQSSRITSGAITPRTPGRNSSGNMPNPQTRAMTANSLAPTSSAADLSQLSPFESLYTETGFFNTKRWFQSVTSNNKQQHAITEGQFIKFLRELSDFGDHEILEIFDIFDKHNKGSIDFNEMFLIISIFAAYTSGQTKKFLYQHGKQIYEVTKSATSDTLSFERFMRLAFVMGISERDVVSHLKDYNLSVYDTISFDEFLLYYFIIFDELDKAKRVALLHQGDNFKSKQNSKKEECIVC